MSQLLGCLAQVFMVLSFGALLLSQFAAYASTLREPNVGVMVAAFGILTVGLCYLAIVVHELGHLVTAVLVGLRVDQIAVGPLALVQVDNAGSWRLRWRKQGPTGMVNVTPRDTTDLRRRWGLMVLMGPLAGIVAGLVCLAVGQYLQPVRASREPGWVGVWTSIAFFFPQTAVWLGLSMFAAFNLLFSVLSLLPQLDGAYASDGEQLRRLWWSDDGEVMLGVLLLNARLQDGVRPRDWDPALVAMLHGAKQPVLEISASLFAFYYARDRGEIEAAGELLDRAVALLEGTPVEKPSSVHVEAAFFEGLHRRDAAEARRHFDLVPEGDQEEHTRKRGEAAVLLAEQRYVEAVAAAEAAIAAAARSRDPGGAIAETEWVEDVLRAAREKVQESGDGTRS